MGNLSDYLGVEKDNEDWREHAGCKKSLPEIFWIYSGREEEAKAICAECEVREECLQFRLSNPNVEPGYIWGGLNPSELRQLERNRGRRDS